MPHATAAELTASTWNVAMWVGAFTLFFPIAKWTTPKVITKPSDRTYWASSVISTVHAIVMLYGAFTVLLSGEVSVWDRFETHNDKWQLYIEGSAGYFLYDLALSKHNDTPEVEP